jgi:hypothetical protein
VDILNPYQTWRVFFALGALLGFAACPERSALVSDASEGQAEAAPDAGHVVEIVDAGPPRPAELQLIVTATSADGGFEVVNGEVDPVKHLGIWVPVVLSDYRLRVFDDSDRIVPSDDAAHETDGGIDYQVTFVEPLKSGRSYRLTVEAQLGPQLEGFRDVEVQFRVRGQVEREPKKTSGKKKKR